MEKKLNKIAEMISQTILSQQLNPDAVYHELDLLEVDILSLQRSTHIKQFEEFGMNVLDLKESLSKLQEKYTQNKVNLRLYQESLNFLLPE